MCVCAVDEWCSVRVCECACAWPPSWFSLWFHCTSVSNASGFARIMYHLDLNTLHIHSQNTLDILLSFSLSIAIFLSSLLSWTICEQCSKKTIAYCHNSADEWVWKMKECNSNHDVRFIWISFSSVLLHIYYFSHKKHEWVSVKNAFKSIIPGWKVWVFSKWHRNFKIKTKIRTDFISESRIGILNMYSFFLVCIRLKWTSQTMQNNLYTCHGRPTSSWYWNERLRSTSRNYVFCLLVLKA